ncbi:hypothetical protein T265_00928 [Opisthorchis viverrini]|uniref:Uncharacterized protein n=1 Tax=Opisthorchis viverrini TaxID=6198 RepID=A0A075A0M5_OPIVI|nr:hypothetical protein T265_00928 [Opisthorchis viverrini]KER33243.1 hypothetical protein T265_00928 [Opisthorchis viverrini]
MEDTWCQPAANSSVSRSARQTNEFSATLALAKNKPTPSGSRGFKTRALAENKLTPSGSRGFKTRTDIVDFLGCLSHTCYRYSSNKVQFCCKLPMLTPVTFGGSTQYTYAYTIPFERSSVNQSFGCSTLSVPSCHAIRRKHEGWDTARLPKSRQGSVMCSRF